MDMAIVKVMVNVKVTAKSKVKIWRPDIGRENLNQTFRNKSYINGKKRP